MGRRCKASFLLRGDVSLSTLISSAIADGRLSDGDSVRVDHRVNGALHTWFVIVDADGSDRLYHEPEDSTLFIEWENRTIAVLNHGGSQVVDNITGADDDGNTYDADDFQTDFSLTVAENPFFFTIQELEGALIRLSEMREVYEAAGRRIGRLRNAGSDFYDNEEEDRLVADVLREAIREGLVSGDWESLSGDDAKAAVEGLLELDSELLSGIVKDAGQTAEEMYASLLRFDRGYIGSLEKVGYDLAVQKAFLEKAGLCRDAVSSILTGEWKEKMAEEYAIVTPEQEAIEDGYEENTRKALDAIVGKGPGTYRLSEPLRPYEYAPKSRFDVPAAYMYPVTHATVLHNGTVCVGHMIDGQAVIEPLQNYIDRIHNDYRNDETASMTERYRDIASSKFLLLHELSSSIAEGMGLVVGNQGRVAPLGEGTKELIEKTEAFVHDPLKGLSLLEREWSAVIRSVLSRLEGHHLAEYMSVPPVLEGKSRINAVEAMMLALSRIGYGYEGNVWVDGAECRRIGLEPRDQGVIGVRIADDGSLHSQRYFNLSVFPPTTELLPRRVLSRFIEKSQLENMLIDGENMKLYDEAMKHYADKNPTATPLARFIASVYLGAMCSADVFFAPLSQEESELVESELVDRLTLDEVAGVRADGRSVFRDVIVTAKSCRDIARQMHLESRLGQRCEAAREAIGQMSEEQRREVEMQVEKESAAESYSL